MIHSTAESAAVQQAAELELPLAAVELQLQALGEALKLRDVSAVDRAAADLHVALASAVKHFALAARRGNLPLPLRHRLALAGGQVAAQREALARATASLDRAIDVLIPRAVQPGVYGASGASDRPSYTGGLVA
jgi:hypothetical protein